MRPNLMVLDYEHLAVCGRKLALHISMKNDNVYMAMFTHALHCAPYVYAINADPGEGNTEVSLREATSNCHFSSLRILTKKKSLLVSAF